MLLLKRAFWGMSLVFILNISLVYAVDYFPAIKGAWWKFEFLDVTQHGRGGLEISGTATWTINDVSGNTISIGVKFEAKKEYTYDRNKQTGAYYNEVTKDINKTYNRDVELEDDDNWIIADKFGEDGCDGLTPWGSDVIAFVHDPDGNDPNPSYMFDVDKISGNERDSVKIRSRTTDNSSQYNKNRSWTIVVTSIEGVGPKSIWRGLGKASRKPIEHQCIQEYILIDYDLGTPIKESHPLHNSLHCRLDVNNNVITVAIPDWSGKDYSVELIDALGRQVFNTTNNQTAKTVLNTENFAMGIYYLKVEHLGKTFLKKISIVR